MELITSHVCKALNLGLNNNLFGGDMLSWLDEAGYIFACKVAKSNKLVTVDISKHSFHIPVKEGDIIEIFGNIDNKGTTSICISLAAERIDVQTGIRETVTNTKIVYVKIDNNGNKCKIEW